MSTTFPPAVFQKAKLHTFCLVALTLTASLTGCGGSPKSTPSPSPSPVNVTTKITFINQTNAPLDVNATLGTLGSFVTFPAPLTPIQPNNSRSQNYTNQISRNASMGAVSGDIQVGPMNLNLPAVALKNGTDVTFTISGNVSSTSNPIVISHNP